VRLFRIRVFIFILHKHMPLGVLGFWGCGV
jgi:hypothetical protein